jgi:ubiquitin carboxyl-terminal hydrolase 8
MNQTRGQMTNPIATPGKFVKTIHNVAIMKGRDIFTGWAQNDLPEFLLFMIECIHNSRRRKISINIRGTTESSTDDLALQCYSSLKDNYELGDYSEL